MQEYLNAFLFQNENCPLPGVGTLYLEKQPARFEDAGQKIIAPNYSIVLNPDVLPPGLLYSFVAQSAKTTEIQAEKDIQGFCNKIISLPTEGKIELNGSGNFYRDEEGILLFHEMNLQKELFPDLEVQKLVRKNEEHSILVGDKETTNNRMTEFFAEDSSVKSDRWWIAALIIFIISAALIIWHYTGFNHPSIFGNHQRF